jgi:hypothetical protein
MGGWRRWGEWGTANNGRLFAPWLDMGLDPEDMTNVMKGEYFDVQQCQEAIVVETGEMWSIVLKCYWVDWIVINMIVTSVRWVITLDKNCLTSECDVFK